MTTKFNARHGLSVGSPANDIINLAGNISAASLNISGSITATTFVGNFSGVVTGGAQQLYTQQQTSNNSYYPTFVTNNPASATSQTVYTTSSITINPGTGAVSRSEEHTSEFQSH